MLILFQPAKNTLLCSAPVNIYKRAFIGSFTRAFNQIT